MVKKAQIAPDWLVFFMFAMFLIIASMFASMVLIPQSIERSKIQILQETEVSSDNLFIYGFLRQKFEERTMVDLISISHMNKDYTELEQKTIEILQKTNRRECFDIYIEKAKMPRTTNECKGKAKEFEVALPIHNQESITFKLVLYE